MIYFVIIDREKNLTVIDLQDCVDYERDEWNTLDDINFYTPEEAIRHAKTMANKLGKLYVPFESRYDSSTNEIQEEADLRGFEDLVMETIIHVDASSINVVHLHTASGKKISIDTEGSILDIPVVRASQDY